jgi:hypothetical protein
MLSKHRGIESDETQLTIIPLRFVLPCILRSTNFNEKIKDASELVLESSKYRTPEEALEAGEIVRNALALSLVRFKIGADLGFKPSNHVITDQGIKYFESQTQKRVLQTGLGLKIYETNPIPIFIQPGVSIKIFSPISKLIEVLDNEIQNPRELNEKEKIALQLYNISFFLEAIEARFLTLVMAIEVLLEFHIRPEKVRQHVDNMIKLTEDNASIEISQKKSLLGSLKWLFNESISQAGRRLAKDKLKDRLYNNMEASKFFTHCYDLRSKLVHCNISILNLSEIGIAIPQLEIFVSDLLSNNSLTTGAKG